MLLKLSRFFLYAAPLSVVIVMVSTFFPFIGGKYYFFRVAVELSLVFFILWWAFEAPEGEVKKQLKEISRKPIFIAVSVFVFAFLLAVVFADNPKGAFWSNYERGEGGFQMIHYYVFFVLSALLLRQWANWKTLFKVSLVAAVLMILYGVLGYIAILKPDLFCVGGGGAQPTRDCMNFIAPHQAGTQDTFWSLLTIQRFQGSLGNPAYVAPYLMFSMFYALYLWIYGSSAKRKFFRNILYGGLLIILFFFFLLSQTRGAFLGLGAAIFAFLAYLGFSKPEWRKKVAGTSIFLVILAGFLAYNRQSDFVKKMPGGRLFDISFSTDAFQTRIWTWGSAWKGFLERPILGWGPENFSTVFDKYFDSRHFVPGKNTETWFDRAHSVVFDYLSETGIVGLVSYLGIFVVFYMQFFRTSRDRSNITTNSSNKKNNHPTILMSLIFAVPVGYLVQGSALFDVLPIYMNLFLFLAFGLYLFHQTNKLNV